MEIVTLVIIGLLLFVVVLPIAALISASTARQGVRALEDRLELALASAHSREQALARRLADLEVRRPVPGEPPPARPEEFSRPVVAPPSLPIPLVSADDGPPRPPSTRAESFVRPGNESVRSVPPEAVAATTTRKAIENPAVSPPADDATSTETREAGNQTFTIEQFMGVKLFAWIGGLALFLGILFFVKLGIERGWISAQVRTAVGFVSGLALVAGGLWVHARKAYAVLGQTLCATGIVVLYGMTYAAHAYYRFPVFVEPAAAFALMTIVTTGAFLLAVRLPAQVVAVLGMLGGFLTPILCFDGRDNPLGLFGYLALVNIGMLAVAARRQWLHLNALAAAGTILMQWRWWAAHFVEGGYAYGSATTIAMAIFLGFAALFAIAAWAARSLTGTSLFPAEAALATCASAMAAAFLFLGGGGIVDRPLLLYGFVLGVNLIVMAIAWKEPRAGLAPLATGLLTFVHLAAWTMDRLTPQTLPTGLGMYLVFGLLHTGYGAWWQRHRSGTRAVDPAWMSVATLGLLLVPVFHFSSVPMMIWLAILAVNLGIIGLAFFSLSLLPVVSALALTMIAALGWLFKLPAEAAGGLLSALTVAGGFGVVFATGGSMLAHRAALAAQGAGRRSVVASWLPAASAVLPFVLLFLTLLKLRVENPSPVFATALLFSLFLLRLGRVMRMDGLPLAALLCTLALEFTWHVHHFRPDHPMLPLVWYLGFHGLFTLHPHVFRNEMAAARAPWAAAALAGAGTFALVYSLVSQTWPNDRMGLLPLAFAVPQLLSLRAVHRRPAPDNGARLSQLAWFGGMALFFITIAVPIQFEKQWITLAWAFEGAALCWLYRRVPHDGLRAVGAGLLVTAFVRLALNPSVLEYHVRGALPVWNWQLYAYGSTALAHLLAAWWLRPPRHLLGRLNLQALFNSLGGILLFLLLNIEIADAFTPPGRTALAFEFHGHFARDMTYSIGWGLFALGTLMVGFAVRSKHTRYAGLGLLGATLLKLFFHDLANLDTLYRSAALIAVALIALGASFLYQRFLGRSEEPHVES